MRRINNITIAVLASLISLTTINAQSKTLTLNDGTITNTGHQAYQDGESLTYTVKYGFITGGRGFFTVRDTVINGIKTNHVVVRGETTGLADVIYKVRDSYESYIDPVTQMPVVAVRNISEGRYKRYEEVTYNHELSKVDTKKVKNDKTTLGTEDIPAYTLDMVSAFYHARNNSFNDNLTKGDTIKYTTYFSGELYPLVIRYLGRETIQTAVGKIECYKFSPVTEVGRSFKSEDSMHVWISCDPNHVPVKIKFNLGVGSFVCELTQYKGMKYNLKTV